MANIVVGVFDEYANAEAARDELLQAGLSEDQVRIVQRQPPQRIQPPSEPDPFWRNIRDYFGIDEEGGDDEASQPIDGAILTVVAQDLSLDAIAEILVNYEPASIDRREQQQPDRSEVRDREA